MDGGFTRSDSSYLGRDDVEGTLPEHSGNVTPGGNKRDKSRDVDNQPDVLVSPLTRKPTYKEQKRMYKVEKKRLTDEILQCFAESTFLLESGWLKARTTIKTWTKIWCELKPGGMILYRNERINESGTWIGTILLNICRIIERPSKKEGFCFKIYHPLEQSIWASKGPHAELFKGFIVPLPDNHVIFRAADDVRGKEWLSSTELVVKHSLDYFTSQQGNSRDSLRRSTSSDGNGQRIALDRLPSEPGAPSTDTAARNVTDSTFADDSHWNDTDSPEEDEEDVGSANGEEYKLAESILEEDHEVVKQTSYSVHRQEELGQHGKGLEEKLPEEDRSLFWHLLLQVRPGMDLSKVVLPTFILDPRSLLDKLSDYYYHCDLISKASQYESPFERMKGIVVWYLSGFYKKPKGVKKPYNPILGEVFRCVWDHSGESPSRTFYIAEQVSHHPPITAFHVSNRREGFMISGGILTRSKYKGNSIQAILDGNGRLKLLNRGEEYIMNMPHLICKGMLFGKLSMDLGGKVTITCPTTGYSAELNFSVWLTRTVNPLEGKIKLGSEVMATLQGSWDGEIFLTDAKTKETTLCWKPLPDQRLTRSTIALDQQDRIESERLWNNVTVALAVNNQQEATREKTILEDNQREAAKDRLYKNEPWIPRLFVQEENGDWIYKHADTRPWDPLLDLYQYESDFVIQTKLRHQDPIFTAPIEAVTNSTSGKNLNGGSSTALRHATQPRRRRPPLSKRRDSDTSSGDVAKECADMVVDSAVAGLPLRASPSVDMIWAGVQTLHSEQTKLATEFHDLSVAFKVLDSSLSLQTKSTFPAGLASKIDSLTKKFEYLLWITVSLIALSLYIFVFQIG